MRSKSLRDFLFVLFAKRAFLRFGKSAAVYKLLFRAFIISRSQTNGNEEKLTLDFVREYAPDESCLSYFLLPYDFYNAEAIVKCVFSGNSADKYVGEEGFFTKTSVFGTLENNAGNDSVPAAVERGKRFFHRADKFGGHFV